jgi:2-polyprenyl-3-methyl-5-hydroxy-6-metoxy-1,4-benzoquinol methylase
MPHYRLHRDPNSSHQRISRLVRGLGKSPVLDVGAAQGFLGQLLDGAGLMLDAVEPDAECCKLCRPHYRNVLEGTIEQVAFPPEKYRVIVCADVLEHTADPVSVLKKLRAVATPDATFIVSVPNVAHLAVRLMLLFGKFPRMDRGILDRTHLQFLTKKTARQMLEQAGLKIVKTSATGISLEEIWPNGGFFYRLLAGFQRGLVLLAPKLFAMQWIFVAELGS